MADLYVPDIATMRDQFLEDLELAAVDAGIENPPIEPGTDWYALATAEANLHAITAANISLVASGLTPLNAEEPYLDEWRQSFGLPVLSPTGSVGKVVVETTGPAAIEANRQLTHASGARFRVVNTYPAVANNDEIDIEAIDKGSHTNLGPGSVLQWVSTPVNVKTKVKVSKDDPLTGGTDEEQTEEKRDRILERTANTPTGGNWGYLREKAFEASPAVQGIYVYPALGGPGSVKVVATQAYSAEILDYTRSPTDALVTLIRERLHRLTSDGVELVVQAAADQYVDVALEVSIPDALLAGGDGTGWLDATPWPPLEGSDTRVSVTSVASTRQVTVNASATSGASAGVTHIAWWNPIDKRFETRLVTVRSGSAGAWVLTVDAPLVASDGTAVAVGDYICPAAVNLTAYGLTWLAAMEQLGPGENTADSDRLPRAARKPVVSSTAPVSLSKSLLKNLLLAHSEVIDADYSYRSATDPSVPASVQTAPNVLVLRRFGVYPS